MSPEKRILIFSILWHGTILLSFSQQEVDSLYLAIEKIYHEHQFDEALKQGLELASAQEEVSDSVSLVHTYELLGRIQDHRYDFDDAFRYYQKSLKLKNSLSYPDSSLLPTYRLISSWYSSMDQDSMSLVYRKKNLEITIREYGESHLQTAISYFMLGRTYYSMSDFLLAEEHYLQALRILQSDTEKNREFIGRIHNYLGVMKWRLAQYEEALAAYQKALDIQMLSTNPDKGLMGGLRDNIGLLYARTGQTAKALESNFKAEQLFREAFGDTSISLAKCYNNIAFTYYYAHDLKNAEKYGKKGLDLKRAIYGENHPEVARNYMMLAGLIQDLQPHRKGFELSRKSIQSNSSRLLPKGELVYPTAEEVIKESFMVEAVIQQAQYLYEIADATLEEKKYVFDGLMLGLDLLNQMLSRMARKGSKRFSLSTFKPIFSNSIYYANELFQETGDSVYLREAIKIGEFTHHYLLKSIIWEGIAKTRAGIPNVLRNQEKQFAQEITFLESILSRTDLTAIRKRETEASLFEWRQKYDSLLLYFEEAYPAYYALKYKELQPDLDKLRTQLASENTLVVNYLWFNHYFYAIGVDGRSISLHKDSISSQLNGLLDQVGDLVLNPASLLDESLYVRQLNQFADIGHELYNILLEPILSSHPNIEKLIMIPDGRLGYLPFELLLTDRVIQPSSYKELPFLVKKYDIRYDYSLEALTYNPAERKEAESDYLGFAPDYEHFSRQLDSYRGSHATFPEASAFGELSFNQNEIEVVARIYRGNALLGPDATESRFKQMGPDYRVLHLAMHAFTDDQNPQNSGLLFSEDLNGEDGILQISELLNLRLPSELIVLSACKTGIGKESEGEGMISLAKAFQYAGSPSLVTSLWQVEDRSTNWLIKRFFEHLNHGMAKDQALRQAKLDFLKQRTYLEAHPFYWAPFVLLGDEDAIQIRNRKKTGWPYLLGFLFVVLAILGERVVRKNRSNSREAS